ncbi:uncharacterized protein N7459_002544 [Penicillium hispanicum]|uniref:uncharacterized protein n=1 Tax=Penicillium hispanicum TaxID=1080232 RepID=UPI00253F6A44|nr:uncharacterized protein N7459_002544 [Penicillium hispanicum]KAJ5586779.1 hypothetical protein N7459_002544 [Penicillium hispanicum]
MAQTRGDRPFSFHNLFKMLLSPNSSSRPAHDEADLPEDLDEPPDQHFLHSSIHPDDHHHHHHIVFAPPPMIDRKESLLTRALKSSPELSPTDPHPSLHDSTYSYRSYPHSNISGISTAELTSDGGLTSPSLSNTPSPPLPPQMMANPASMSSKQDVTPKVKVLDTSETHVEANLGRKRCISFACNRQTSAPKQEKSPVAPQPTQTTPSPAKDTLEPPKRKSTLTFVCPGRQPTIQRDRSPARRGIFRSRCRGSPAPVSRKTTPATADGSKEVKTTAITLPKTKGVPTSGLGKFEESEATRFHEFASSMDEDDEWVTKDTDYSQKITLNDCMKKENAIRRLAEEVEEEAEEEEDEDEEDADDIADDDSTVHDFSSDDGNESDNEAGFAESDESDDEGSDYEFWAPSAVVSEASVQSVDVPPPTLERRTSNTSFDSMTDEHPKWLPAPVQRMNIRRSKPIKMRPGTPNLPDSTDFVCGTLDEDRPLEAAYKSCMEQRRLSKHIPIPQDIDPSFPTSDPEDNEDLEDVSQEDLEDFALEPTRGRAEGAARKASPRPSPKRMMSPPPRRAGRSSPKRLKSPPPRVRAKSPPPHVRAKSPSPEKWTVSDNIPVIERPRGVNISHLVQRQPLVRTRSLPRTPNPFFTSLEKSHRWHGIPPLTESPEREHSRTRELHTRGPIDIVEGLEKKRQKRKEKFWRQHCRKAAKEQMVRRPIPGKGAERMKELGLEVAERCRAYGVGQDAQLVLSV